MQRQPKVACVEIDCFLKDAPKTGELCGKCKARFEFLAAIENGWCIPCRPDDTTIYCRFPFDPKDWKYFYLEEEGGGK